MASFEELQALWQKQPARAATPQQAADLTTAFRRFGRRHDVINIVKLTLIICQTFFLVRAFRHYPYAAFGGCLAIFSVLVFFIRDWRAQRAVARLDFSEPSIEFLHVALARLNALRNPFRNPEFFIAMAGAWVGMNLMFTASWTVHLLTLATPFLIHRFASFVRGRRFERETQPLIDRLNAVLGTLETSSL